MPKKRIDNLTFTGISPATAKLQSETAPEGQDPVPAAIDKPANPPKKFTQSDKNLQREIAYILEYNRNGGDGYQAALKAGYSESTAKGGLQYKWRQPRFQELVRQIASGDYLKALLSLQRIDNLHLKFLVERAEENSFEEVAKGHRTLDRVARLSGLLKPPEQDQKPATINIKEVQNLMLKL